MDYYIQKRINPQFKEPYYLKRGKMSKAAVKRAENPIYGTNVMLQYKTEADYLKAIDELEKAGNNIR